MEDINLDDMYVVVTYDEHGKPALCYKDGKTPFIGTLDKAKKLLCELEEWDQDEEYVYLICNLSPKSFMSHIL